MATHGQAERAALSDLLLELGADAPTLCAGWVARDLAAHLVVREHRPDAAVGILAKPFAAHTKRVQDAEAARPWPVLVERVRGGPPAWSPTRIEAVDTLVNTVEFFVHHEDVRRAQAGWTARALDPELVVELHAALARGARLLVRKAPAGITLEPTEPALDPIVAKRAEPTVTVRGPVGELTLFVYGRGDHALVDFDGPPDAVAAVRATRFGI